MKSQWVFLFIEIHAFCLRERQLKLEKVKASRQQMEELKREQAEWRRMEQKRIEEENRRIMEFARQQQHTEETRRNQMRQWEEAKEYRHKMVEKTSSSYQLIVCWFFLTLLLAVHFCYPAVWEDRRGEKTKRGDGACLSGALFGKARGGIQTERNCEPQRVGTLKHCLSHLKYCFK